MQKTFSAIEHYLGNNLEAAREYAFSIPLDKIRAVLAIDYNYPTDRADIMARHLKGEQDEKALRPNFCPR